MTSGSIAASRRRAGRTRSCRSPPSGPRGRCRAGCRARSRSTRSPGRAAGGRAGRARGCAATRPARSSRRAGCTSTIAALVVELDELRRWRAWRACSRRMPVIHASAPASARSSAATLASPQQCSGPVHGGPGLARPRRRRARRSAPRRRARSASVSGKSTPVSIVTTRVVRRRARSSTSRITDSSFWKEHRKHEPRRALARPWPSVVGAVASDRALALAALHLEGDACGPSR